MLCHRSRTFSNNQWKGCAGMLRLAGTSSQRHPKLKEQMQVHPASQMRVKNCKWELPLPLPQGGTKARDGSVQKDSVCSRQKSVINAATEEAVSKLTARIHRAHIYSCITLISLNLGCNSWAESGNVWITWHLFFFVGHRKLCHDGEIHCPDAATVWKWAGWDGSPPRCPEHQRPAGCTHWQTQPPQSKADTPVGETLLVKFEILHW